MWTVVLVVSAIGGIGYLFYWLEQQNSSPGEGAAAEPGMTDAQAAPTIAGEEFNPFYMEPRVTTPTQPQTPWARGIARAEGFYQAGSLPQRSHNPGDLTKSFGFVVTGTANKEGVLIFASDEDGWGALEAQRQLIANGKSRFSLDMPVYQFAYTWTLGREPINDAEQAGVDGWVRAFLQEVGQGLTANSSIGEDTQTWSA